MDGLYGAIVVAAADLIVARPFGLVSSDPGEQAAMMRAEKRMQPLFISDWSQFTSEEFYAVQAKAHIDYTCVDSIIINGAVSGKPLR